MSVSKSMPRVIRSFYYPVHLPNNKVIMNAFFSE